MHAGENPAAVSPALTSDAACREERRRADLLLQCAQVLHSHLAVADVMNALAERVQAVMCSRMVTVLLKTGEEFHLAALATSDRELETAVRAAHAQGECRFAHELATRASEAREPLAFEVTG